MEDKLNIKNSLLERFLKYVKIWSESDSQKADSGIMPSTSGQNEMASVLCAELKSLGLENVQTTEHCYTYGILPANGSAESSICLLAHIDGAVQKETGSPNYFKFTSEFKSAKI